MHTTSRSARASGWSNATRADSASSSVVPASPPPPASVEVAQESWKNIGWPPASRDTRSISKRPVAPGTRRSASSRHSSSVSGPIRVRSTGRPSSSASSASSSPRTVARTSTGGAPAPRSSSRSSRKLSASAHWRSSIVITTRCARAIADSRSRNAANIRRRCSSGSPTSRSETGAAATASTRWNTGNSRTSRSGRGGSTRLHLVGAMRVSTCASPSATPSNALYGTDSRS